MQLTLPPLLDGSNVVVSLAGGWEGSGGLKSVERTHFHPIYIYIYIYIIVYKENKDK
jgi:hypothetical protein